MLCIISQGQLQLMYVESIIWSYSASYCCITPMHIRAHRPWNMHAHIYGHMHKPAQVSYAHTYMYSQTCIHTHAFTHMHTHTCIHTHAYTHMHARTNMHIHYCVGIKQMCVVPNIILNFKSKWTCGQVKDEVCVVTCYIGFYVKMKNFHRENNPLIYVLLYPICT